MKKSSLFLIIFLSLLFSACSKPAGQTTAKLKLNLSGIVDITSGIGSGGAILFGRNSNGDMFGKKLSSAEENLDIPNGSWTFYALMWGNGSSTMNGKVHCGKTASQLNGSAVTISMSLNNANCADSELSGGKVYTAGDLRFADIFIEECDEINGSTGFSCGLANQGSALSYRFVFSSFKKNAAGTMVTNPADSLVSDCKLVNSLATSANVYFSGLPVNFPSGNGPSPFIGSIEFFMDTTDCNSSDAKGVRRFTLHQGAGAVTSPQHHVLVSDKTCTPGSSDFVTGTDEQKKDKCESFFGSWSGSSCTGTFLPVVKRFAPAAVCSSQAPANIAIKHQFIIPTAGLCLPYMNNSTQIGSHPFSGGDGLAIRPYKICTEWQMNQIGEKTSPGYLSSHFKLMNDLDMNKADFGPYAKPDCVGTGTLVGSHHNLNPLTKITDDCTAPSGATLYTGTFNGNNKTIKNGRIQAKTVDYLGFVRKLGTSGKIKNLNFLNLEVEGDSNVGGLAGYMGSFSEVSNIKFKDGEIRAQNNYAGTVTARLSINAKVDFVRTHGVEVQATDYLGGLVGENQGAISRSMFNGFIDHYNNVTGYVGGITGINLINGTIEKTFSEGAILSSAQYSGGIAGSSAGTINHVYSTMMISSRYMNNNAAVGGIVGTNSGTIGLVYSDSFLEYTGTGASPSVDGAVATGSAPGTCYTSSSATSCTATSYANFRNNSLAVIVTDPAWTSELGTLPRLTWEAETDSRPCLLVLNRATVAAQTAAGRGSSANPIVLCTSDQVKAMSGGLAFKLAEDLSLADWVDTNTIATFSGVFDGGGHSLYRLNITSASSISLGMFKNNSGTIKNLNLMGNKITYTGTNTAGILTGNNTGTIYDVDMIGNYLDGRDYVGSVAGLNTGTIKQVFVEAGLIKGQSYVGGIVGNNNGTISQAVAKVDLKEAYPEYFKFGGVAGANTGTIDQTVFEGKMEFTAQVNSGAETNVSIGGIVGYNNGSVSNSVTENYSLVKTKNYNHVGGLIGRNDSSGTVATSMSLAGVIYNYPPNQIPPTKSFHQLIGSNSGTVDLNSFALEKHAGAFIGSAQAISCSGAYVSFTGSPSFLSLGNTSTDMFNRQMNGGGNSVTSYITYGPPDPAYVIASNAVCSNNDFFDIFKSFTENPNGFLVMAPAAFQNTANFSGYDMAITDEATPANSTRQADLFEYYLATMDNRAPVLPVPIWEFDVGEGRPRLTQIDH